MKQYDESQQVSYKQAVKKTYTDTLEKLHTHRKCMILRCTGFGKTFILAHLTKAFKKVLYVYPKEVIAISLETEYKEVVNERTDKITYKFLGILGQTGRLDEIRSRNYDLIIFDEAHCLGALQPRAAIEELLPYIASKGISIVGATATPDRYDGYDVTERIFSGITCYDYLMHDCIQDGIMPKIHYVLSGYHLAESIKHQQKIIDKNTNLANVDKQNCIDTLSNLQIALANKLNIPEMFHKHILQATADQSYLKFMIFLPNKSILQKVYTRGDVPGWFNQAFPGKTIRQLIVTSDNEYKDNISKISDLKRKPNHIDLIYSIDMLNYGYHVEDITGIIMLRMTHSNIIFNQQVGRTISIRRKEPPLVFDLVYNIHLRPYYTDTYTGVKPKRAETNETAETDETEMPDETDETAETAKTRCTDRVSGITPSDLQAYDELAGYREILERVDNIVKEADEKYLLSLWDNQSMPIDYMAKHFHKSKHMIRAFLIKNNRIEPELA